MDKADVVSTLVKREQERQLEVQKRRIEKNQLDAENEKLGYFQKIYQEERKQIERAIDDASCIAAELLPEHFDNLYKSILKLQKYVAASNVYLRVYDIQKSNKELLELTNKAKELEGKLLPKKKFGFKNKRQVPKLVDIKTNGVSHDETDSAHHTRLLTTLNIDFCGFQDRRDEYLSLFGENIFKKDVSAANLINCKVIFKGNPSTLHLSNLKNCVILSGPVSTSVFAENCEGCTIVVACQQLRLHSSKNIQIYLHVTSKGILEDCSDISVAPYNFNYDTIKNDFKSSGLDENINHWDSLDDFNWLNIKQHSPNWRVMDEDFRNSNWDDYVKS